MSSCRVGGGQGSALFLAVFHQGWDQRSVPTVHVPSFTPLRGSFGSGGTSRSRALLASPCPHADLEVVPGAVGLTCVHTAPACKPFGPEPGVQGDSSSLLTVGQVRSEGSGASWCV